MICIASMGSFAFSTLSCQIGEMACGLGEALALAVFGVSKILQVFCLSLRPNGSLPSDSLAYPAEPNCPSGFQIIHSGMFSINAI